MSKSRSGSNGDEIPVPDPGVLQRILGLAKSERTEQEAFGRTHDAREKARRDRVRAQKDRKEGKK